MPKPSMLTSQMYLGEKTKILMLILKMPKPCCQGTLFCSLWSQITELLKMLS